MGAYGVNRSLCDHYAIYTDEFVVCLVACRLGSAQVKVADGVNQCIKCESSSDIIHKGISCEKKPPLPEPCPNSGSSVYCMKNADYDENGKFSNILFSEMRVLLLACMSFSRLRKRYFVIKCVYELMPCLLRNCSTINLLASEKKMELNSCFRHQI